MSENLDRRAERQAILSSSQSEAADFTSYLMTAFCFGAF
jgi:hypothetical protein